MKNTEFQQRLEKAVTDDEITALAFDVFRSVEFGDPEDELKIMPEQIGVLLDHGLDPDRLLDNGEDESCALFLEFGYTDSHLDAAKLIFERCGIPHDCDEDDPDSNYTLMSRIGTKIDYNYFGCDYAVKLYLLCSAYSDEENYLQFNQNLTEKVLQECYTQPPMYAHKQEDGSYLLTTEIFKDIHSYDYTIEFLPKQPNRNASWRIHIYHKESHIEVAVY